MPRTLPAPDERYEIPGRGTCLVYRTLEFNDFAVDDIIEVEGERYVIRGIETTSNPGSKHFGFLVRKI